MKTLTRSLMYTAIFIASAATTSIQAANSSSYSFNKLSQELCLVTQTNNVAKLRSTLTKSKASINNIYVEVDCNGQSLLQVAQQNQAFQVAKYLKAHANIESTAAHPTIAEVSLN